MALKFSFQGETRRFPAGALPSLEDYEAVRERVRGELNLMSGFRFEYTDSDGDLITVRTQGEWVEALSCQEDQTPKFAVIGSKNPAPVPAKAPPSGPIVVCGLPVRGIETGPAPTAKQSYIGHHRGRFYQPPTPAPLPLPSPPAALLNLEGQEREAAAVNKRAIALIKARRLEEAVELLTECLGRFPQHSHSWYNSACAFSLLKRHDEAIDALRKAKSFGFGNVNLAIKDTDLENLRELPEFADWLLAFRPDQAKELTGDHIYSAYISKAHRWSRYTWGAALLGGVSRLNIEFSPLKPEALVAGAACAAASGCTELALQALGAQVVRDAKQNTRVVLTAMSKTPEIALLSDSQEYQQLKAGVEGRPIEALACIPPLDTDCTPPSADGTLSLLSEGAECIDLTELTDSDEEEEEVVPEPALAPPAPEDKGGVEGRGFEYAQEFAVAREVGVGVPDEMLRETLRKYSGDLEAVMAHLMATPRGN